MTNVSENFTSSVVQTTITQWEPLYCVSKTRFRYLNNLSYRLIVPLDCLVLIVGGYDDLVDHFKGQVFIECLITLSLFYQIPPTTFMH